jgi:acetyl esterase/lipase
MLLAWARDTGLRAVDGAVVLSPGTDVTMSAPSIVENLPTDPMLAPMLRDFLRMPRPVRLFITWATTKIKPSDPRVSPVFGGLSGLPPVLVHASEAEVLRDDAKRWVNKAREAGSPASLETWPHVVHVWHAFAPDLPESVEAWEHIRQFFEHCALREVATAS